MVRYALVRNRVEYTTWCSVFVDAVRYSSPILIIAVEDFEKNFTPALIELLEENNIEIFVSNVILPKQWYLFDKNDSLRNLAGLLTEEDEVVCLPLS